MTPVMKMKKQSHHQQAKATNVVNLRWCRQTFSVSFGFVVTILVCIGSVKGPSHRNVSGLRLTPGHGRVSSSLPMAEPRLTQPPTCRPFVQGSSSAAVVCPSDGGAPLSDGHGPRLVDQQMKKKKATNGGTSSNFQTAFFSALGLLLASELGDKTFFVTVLLALEHSRLLVFTACYSAIALNALLTVMVGMAASLIPQMLMGCLTIGLYIFFGLKMIYEASNMEENQVVLEEDELKVEPKSQSQADAQSPLPGNVLKPALTFGVTSSIFYQAFVMNFVGELGDRSQMSTIALAASQNIYGVTLGTLFGHAICTSLAVMAGKWVAGVVSPKRITLLGGVILIAFAALQALTTFG